MRLVEAAAGAAPLPLQPTLEGPTLRLRPLRAEDLAALHAVAADPLLWAGHPSRDRWRRDVFEGWFAEALASGGALVVEERATGRTIGSSRFYDLEAERGEVAIGFTFLARDWWGGAANAEMKRLMLEHAFRSVRTVWFHVAASNLRSQRAMAKIGGRLSHRGVRGLTGEPLEYLFYRIDAGDPLPPLSAATLPTTGPG